jgi:serine/threonine-protein kinase
MGDMETSYNETVPNGHIISQNPVAGSIVYSNTAVNIVVSEGSNLVCFPNLVGMNRSDALVMLHTMQFIPEVTYSFSDTVEADYIISQNPQAGAYVTQNSLVNIVVSKGRAE